MKPYKRLFTESPKTDYTKFFKMFSMTKDCYLGPQVKSASGEIVSEVDCININDIETIKSYLDSVGIFYTPNKINPKKIMIFWSSKSNIGSNIVSSSEIGKIVNISNLKWNAMRGQFSAEEATSVCPRGWRLPTIHELHSLAMAQQKDGNYYNKLNFYPSDFYTPFCSSSVSKNDSMWLYDFRINEAFINPISNNSKKSVVCVR